MTDYFDMTGKVVLVTGGSRGLGHEMVKAFAAAGADVVIASRKLEPFGYSRSQAWQDIRDLRRVWTMLLPSWSVLDQVDVESLTEILAGKAAPPLPSDRGA